MSHGKLASLLIGGIAIVALSGCEQLEQAANEVTNDVRQTAIKALDEARQAGSIDEARQSADNALEDVRQQAAGLLQQASDFLSGKPPGQDRAQQAAEAAPVNATDTGS